MTKNITETLAKFSSGLKFEDLPDEVVHEAKRGLLDSIGCAIGATDLEKGSFAIKLINSMGGQQESTVLGTKYKVPAPNAAFANGELMHALDYTALLPPGHSAPYVDPSPLAIAEARKSSGKSLILATVLGHEIATRIGVSLGGFRLKNGQLARVFGMSYNIFGAAAGAGRIIGLDEDRMADALGLAGYFAPIPSHQKFLFTSRNGMQKYGPSGWIAQGGLTASLLAEMGERGDREVAASQI
jgi:2-methylcitrate dehydratase PrpD